MIGGDILKMVQNLIKFARQTLKADDSGDYQTKQTTFLGQTQSVRNLGFYGFYGHSPKDSEVMVIASRGNSDDKWGISDDYINRFRNLKEGECAQFNQLTGTFTHFKANGDIDIFAAANETVNITGDATINIGGNQIENIKGKLDETVDGDKTETLKAKSTLEVTGEAEETFKDNLTQTAEKDKETTVEGSVTKTITLDETETVLRNKIETIAVKLTKNVPVTDWTGIINLTGDLVFNGISLTGHIHGGVDTGIGDTEGPDNP